MELYSDMLTYWVQGVFRADGEFIQNVMIAAVVVSAGIPPRAVNGRITYDFDFGWEVEWAIGYGN